MAAEEVVHIIHDTAGHHALGSYHPFFTGLEADFQGAGHFVLVGCHQFGYRKADGGVTVMAAGVHQAGVLGSKALCSGPVLFCPGPLPQRASRYQSAGQRYYPVWQNA